MNIVVVEDEAALCEEIVFHLQRINHEVAGVDCAAALYRHLSVTAVDMIVLDLGLPDEDGLCLAPHLQEKGYGVVMLTARGTLEDRITGLQQGADAYLNKPVDFNLLDATLNSVFRRLGEKPTIQMPHSAWRLDNARFTLYSPDGQAITLTAKETTLLNLLTSNPCATVDRRTLNHALNPCGNDLVYRLEVLDYRLETLISRLRQKVFQQTSLVLPLKTVHGIGYNFMSGV